MPIPVPPLFPLRLWLAFPSTVKRPVQAVRILVAFLALLLAMALPACGTSETPGWSDDRQEEQKEDETDDGKDEEPTLPNAPTVTAEAGDGVVTLTWSDVEHADSYVVYFGAEELDAKTATRIDSATSPQVIHDLDNGTTYLFAVAGRNDAGEGEWSKIVVATPTAALVPPAAPSDVVAVAADAQVTVTWSAVEGAEAYELFWSDTTPIHRDTATHVAPVTSPHVVTGLENDTTWYFALIATNAAGESALSHEASATPTKPETAPQPPANVVAVAGDGEVELTWDPVASATSYDVFWTDEAELSAANLDAATRQSDAASPLVVSALTNGTTYRFAVIARNAVGDSDLSEVVSATPEATLLPPQPPTNVAAMAGDGSVTVSWDPAATATSYDLLYTDESALTEATATRLSGVASPIEIEDLTNGTTYRFAVVALNAAGASDPSEMVSATPKAALLPPQPPANVVATAGDGSVTVSWDPVATATSYDLLHTDESALTEATATRLSGVTSPVEIEELSNGTTYRFAVSAVNEAGASAVSVPVEATPLPPPPAAPTLVTVEAGIQQLEVSWESDPLADSHTVYVGTATPFMLKEAEIRLSDATSPATIPNLEPRTSYSVVVISSRMGVVSPPSVEKQGTPLAPVPDAPGNVELTVGDGELTVLWANDDWAVSSDLYYGTESPVSEVNATRREDVTSPYTITGLTNGTRYYVALVARNESGSSHFSNEVNATPLALPESPTDLVATPDNGEVSLFWTSPPTATSHTIYFRAGTDPENGHPDTEAVVVHESSHTVTGLRNGTTYYFSVSASNASGEGPMSNSVQATPVDLRPVITGVFPIEGRLSGRIDVTLTGSNFELGSTPRIWFGEVEASSVTVDSDEQITVEAPQAVASGWVPLRISNEVGETVRDSGFVYSPFPGAARVELDIQTQIPAHKVAIGDFNEDGALDFATTSRNTGRIEVIFGDGAGGESGNWLLSLGAGARGQAIVAGDFNGDGHLDLAGAHETFVQVHYGNGEGKFTSGERMTGIDVQDLVAADLDGDGRLELIVAYKEEPAAIFAANDERQWSRVATLPATPGSQTGVAVGNFNGSDDDLLDVALLSLPARIDFLLQDDSRKVGDDHFGFREGPSLSLGASTTYFPGLVVRDFDGDGLDDLAVSTRDVYVLKQDDSGFFDSVKYDMGNVALHGIHAADLDRDGLLDLVVLDSVRSEAAILYGTAPGEFAPAVGLGIRGNVLGGAVADFNGDGVLDILALGGASTTFAATWLLNDGVHRPGTQKEAFRHDRNASGGSILRGRFLDDRETVALIGGFGSNSWIRLFKVLANGAFEPPVSVRAGNAPSLADAADFFGLDTPQIVLNSSTAAQITLVSDFESSPTVTDIETPGVVTSLAAGQIDDDGYADLALAIPSTEEIVIGLYDHNGGFEFSSIPIKADHLALGDFDGDGDLDLVYADGRDLGFVWNDQPGFTPDETTTQHLRTIQRVRTADVDGDGRTDVLVIYDGSSLQRPRLLAVHRNNGDGTWTVSEYEVGIEATDCAVGDGNRDDVPDIFVTNRREGTVSFLQGDGAGGFLQQVAIDAGGSPNGIAIRNPAIRRQKVMVYVGGDHERSYLTVLQPW